MQKVNFQLLILIKNVIKIWFDYVGLLLLTSKKCSFDFDFKKNALFKQCGLAMVKCENTIRNEYWATTH